MREGYSKEQLIKLLELTIKATRAGSDVEKLTLEGKYVVIHYKSSTNGNSGTKKVNIDGDSGIAIVMDVARRV